MTAILLAALAGCGQQEELRETQRQLEQTQQQLEQLQQQLDQATAQQPASEPSASEPTFTAFVTTNALEALR